MSNFSLISGQTLAIRTRQRNHLIMRLRGAAAFANHLGLYHQVKDYNRIIEIVKQGQLLDSAKNKKQKRKV